MTNPRSASFELGPTQATIQDFDTEAHSNMLSPTGVVCGDRAEGHILSCLDLDTDHFFSLPLKVSIPVQCPPFRHIASSAVVTPLRLMHIGFSTGFRLESRDGHGTPGHIAWQSLRSVTIRSGSSEAPGGCRLTGPTWSYF